MKNSPKPKPSQGSKTELSDSQKAMQVGEASSLRTHQLGLIAQATLMTRRNGIAQNQNPGLVRVSSELAKTEPPSSQVLELAHQLDAMTQVYQMEIMPGAVRLWQSSFAKERPEAIAWGFREWVRRSPFPPKPGDIGKLIRERRESPYFDGWNSDISEPDFAPKALSLPEPNVIPDSQNFFHSQEYKDWVVRMKKEHNI